MKRTKNGFSNLQSEEEDYPINVCKTKNIHCIDLILPSLFFFLCLAIFIYYLVCLGLPNSNHFARITTLKKNNNLSRLTIAPKKYLYELYFLHLYQWISSFEQN